MTTTMTATGPVLVFGGPYSNLEATTALLAAARDRGIASDHVICTGDLVAYCGDPQPVIDLIRASGIAIVQGNCEEQLAAGAADCGCGFEEGTACAVLSDQWYAYASRHVDAESRVWLGSLPRRLILSIAGYRFAVIHGGVTSINRFVFASDAAAMEDEIAAVPDCDGIIGGHCGLPFTRTAGDRLWHNAGAIGLPANDGTARVWYSVLTPADGGLLIEHIPLDYDHAAAATRIRERGLPEGYAAALETGLWPSCDVLTPAELACRGRPLSPGTLTWRAGEEVAWQG